MNEDHGDIMSGQLTTPRDEKGRSLSRNSYGDTNHQRRPFYGEVNHHRDSLYYGDKNHQNLDETNHQSSYGDRNHQNFDERNRPSFYGDVNHQTFDERYNPSPLGGTNHAKYYEKNSTVGKKLGENNSPKYLTPTDILDERNRHLAEQNFDERKYGLKIEKRHAVQVR